MRTLIALAFAATLGISAAHAADTAQVAAKEPAATVTRTEPVSNSEARDIAKAWMKENDIRFGRVGNIRKQKGMLMIELQSADGIRFKTLQVDPATGEIVG
ncbi:hypothetical protein [Niveispirillum fermenti]|uniref:hypothetical protein n=1 Tax=Niveispirillum fermenti TaxID=1233113 RepID=UPI003A839BB2